MNERMNSISEELMIKAAWNLTYTSFWNTWTLSSNEMRLTKKFIRKFITNAQVKYEAYVEYCERVLLAREYLINNPEKYVPIPSKWFDTNNMNGFIGTGRWFENMRNMRRSLPLYRNHFRALPEAILEMLEEPSGRIFHYWRNWFVEREKHASVNLFLSVVANFHFQISKI